MPDNCHHSAPEDMELPPEVNNLRNQNEVVALLDQPNVQKALAEFFIDYWNDFYDVYLSAVTQNGGRRPDQITNEMFSALHHVARGLVIPTANDVDEIDKARTSHIKRATMDSYKIAINTALEAERAMNENLDHIMGNDELARRQDYESLLNNIRGVKEFQRLAQTAYIKAKNNEARGKFPQAVNFYKESLEQGLNMGALLRNFRDDPHVSAALIKEGKRVRERVEDKLEERRERKKDRWLMAVLALVSAVVGSIATVAVRDYLIPKYYTSNPAVRSETPASQPPAAAPVYTHSLNSRE